MKYTILATSLLLPFSLGRTAGELCRGTAQLSQDGNWYCSEVQAITYRNISQAGTYNRTTYVDPRTGLCGHERLYYPATGPLTPLFGDVLPPILHRSSDTDSRAQVSMHLRGPMNISKLAVYQLPSEVHKTRKRNTVPFYGSPWAMNQQSTKGTGGITQPSRATKGRWAQFFGTRTSNTTADLPPVTLDETLPSAITSSSLTTDTPNPAPTSPHVRRRIIERAAASWNRVAYYTSTAPAQATGLSFLANLGDPRQSGTFD